MRGLPPGPYRDIGSADGHQVPWYMMPFDKKGRCTAPLTRDHLLSNVQRGLYTDVYLFSHGWNNDWAVATTRYEDFTTRYVRMRREHGLDVGREYRPLLVGVFWPSAALVLPWEQPRKIAAADPKEIDREVADDQVDIADLAADVKSHDVDRFYRLVQRSDGLQPDEALELARIVAPALGHDDEIATSDGPPTAEDLVALWRLSQPSSESEADEHDFGVVDDVGTRGEVELDAAGALSRIDPRHAVRALTVWRMKDRAGTVGARGVNPLLAELLAASAARIHLVGHSFGAKVVMSATCAAPLSRKVASALLLQPAISCFCFAADGNGEGTPGGYRAALDRIDLPILSTFSPHDFPLSKTFHLALRRRHDAGELKIAAAGDPPSRFAALGGYGPQGLGDASYRMTIRQPTDDYVFPGPARVVGLDGTGVIKGHGKISNDATCWALFQQVRAS